MCKKGKDSRFDDIKKSKLKFLSVWLMQGLFTIVPTGPLLVILTVPSEKKDISVMEMFGIFIWLTGLII